MRLNIKSFLWVALSLLMLGFPMAVKADAQTASEHRAVLSGKATGTAILVDDRGRRGWGRWGGDRDDYRYRRGRDWDRHRRWDRRYDRRHYYYPRSYYYRPYGYYPYYDNYYYNYNPYYYPYGSYYPGSNGFIGGFFRLW